MSNLLFLEKSPLKSLDLFSDYTNLYRNRTKVIETTAINSPKFHINNNNNTLPNQVEINFPLEIGRAILKDTLNENWLINYQSQEYVNQNIKKAVTKKPIISIGKLIDNYGVSICELKSSRIIVDIDDLIKHNFHPKDLTINKTLFNVNHLQLLFQIDYKLLLKRHVPFHIFNIEQCEFDVHELQTIKFDFNLCFLDTQQTIEKNIQLRDGCFDEMRNSLKKLNMTYDDLIQFGLTKDHLKYFKIKEDRLRAELKKHLNNKQIK